jgi:hypothetical protein
MAKGGIMTRWRGEGRQGRRRQAFALAAWVAALNLLANLLPRKS